MARGPGGAHGPRGERQRGHRLDTAQATWLLQQFVDAPGSAYCQRPLGALAAVLAAAYRRKAHAALDDGSAPHGAYEMRPTLRWRAERVLSGGGVPRWDAWCPSGMAAWSPSFRSRLLRVWKVIRRTSRAVRKHAVAAPRSRAVAPPRSRAVASSVVGLLGCAFPDVALPSLRRARLRVSLWHPPRVALPSNALSQLLVAADAAAGPLPPCHQQLHPQQLKQASRVKRWGLGRAAAGGCPTVFAIGVASDAIRGWRDRSGKGPNAVPPVSVLRSFLNKTRIALPTPLCSPSGGVTLLLCALLPLTARVPCTHLVAAGGQVICGTRRPASPSISASMLLCWASCLGSTRSSPWSRGGGSLPRRCGLF